MKTERNRSSMNLRRGTALLLASAVLAAGCASREPLPELLAARQAVDRAAQDPESATAAAARLAEARKQLAAAETATRERGDEETIRDHAFAATRNAEIAVEQSAEARARQAVQEGEANRNRVLLESRTREAAAARADADANRASAEASRASAEASQANAAASAEEAERARRELEALEAKPTERGMVLTLGDVLFETARAEVKPGARANVERVADFLSANPGVRVLVEGHTDSRGSDEYNTELSRRRAESVRDVIVGAGVPADRINAIGRGEAYPVAGNDNAAGQQQNRRVEIVFSDEGGTFAGSGRNSVD
jgi:outer membrane protein OmpA-like peptidoglycan-associated protein